MLFSLKILTPSILNRKYILQKNYFSNPEKFNRVEILYRYTKKEKKKYMDYIEVSNHDGDTITHQTILM